MLIMLLTRTMLLVVLLLRGYGLLTMGAVLATSEIVVRVLQTIFARKLLSQFVLSPRKIDFRLLREMLAYGINTFLYMGGAFIILQASNIIIGMFIGDREISQFQAAAAGVVLLSQFLYAFTGAIKPAVSDLDARDDEWRVKEIAFLTQKYSLLMIIPAGCFFVAMGRQFLWIWVGGTSEDLNPTTISTMGVILTILAVGHCLRLAQHSNFLVLVGRGQHRIFGILMALTAVLCVSASVVSVKVFNLGLVAIAWSNCLPMVLISGVILPIYFNWTMKISAWESVRRVWWPALLGGLPSVVLISVWKYMSVPDSWAEIFAVVFLTMAVTLVSCWFLSLEAIERRRLVHIVLRK
jgi:O-antigen/teichoic acid export membrane protein